MRSRLAPVLVTVAFLGVVGGVRAGERVASETPPANNLDEARARRDLLLPKLWTHILKEKANDPNWEKQASARRVASVARTAVPAREAELEPAPERGWVHLRLEEAVETALRHNLPAQIARLSRDAVEYEIPKAKAIFHPTVGLSAQAAGDRDVPENGPTTNVKNQDGRAFVSQLTPTGGSLVVSSALGRETPGELSEKDHSSAGAVSVIQPIMRGGGFVVATRPIKDARYDLRIEEARLQAEILRVIAAAKTTYYGVLLAEEIIRVTTEAIERDRSLVDASRELLEAGMITKRDLYQAEFLLSSDTSKLVEARAAREEARIALLDVLGIPIGTEVTLVDRSLDAEPIPLELERWIDTAVERRPEVLEVKYGLDKNLLDIRVSTNAVLPQLDLIASYGKDQIGSTLPRALNLKGEAWTAGLAFSVPVGNVAARADLAQANVRQEALKRILAQQERQVELQVRTAAIKVDRSLNSATALRSAIEHVFSSLEVARGQFSLGLATNLAVTEAQEDLLDTQTDLLTSLVDYHVGLAELEASVAGPL
jgi:outer membrane protein TolC